MYHGIWVLPHLSRTLDINPCPDMCKFNPSNVEIPIWLYGSFQSYVTKNWVDSILFWFVIYEMYILRLLPLTYSLKLWGPKLSSRVWVHFELGTTAQVPLLSKMVTHFVCFWAFYVTSECQTKLQLSVSAIQRFHCITQPFVFVTKSSEMYLLILLVHIITI